MNILQKFIKTINIFTILTKIMSNILGSKRNIDDLSSDVIEGLLNLKNNNKSNGCSDGCNNSNGITICKDSDISSNKKEVNINNNLVCSDCKLNLYNNENANEHYASNYHKEMSMRKKIKNSIASYGDLSSSSSDDNIGEEYIKYIRKKNRQNIVLMGPNSKLSSFKIICREAEKQRQMNSNSNICQDHVFAVPCKVPANKL